MRTFLASAVMLAVLTGAAYAQMGGINAAPSITPSNREEEAKAAQERAEVEKRYDDTMKKLRNEPARKVDPWGNVRAADPKH